MPIKYDFDFVDATPGLQLILRKAGSEGGFRLPDGGVVINTHGGLAKVSEEQIELADRVIATRLGSVAKAKLLNQELAPIPLGSASSIKAERTRSKRRLRKTKRND